MTCWPCELVAQYALNWLNLLGRACKMTRDYCWYALDVSVLPNSCALWDWNTGRLRRDPMTIIDDVELGNRRETP